jgi:hypothetical protein
MKKLKTLIPDPDSQFRLRECKCGSGEAEYLLLGGAGEEVWTVQCPKCGIHTPYSPIRHNVQVYWNKHLAERPIIRRAI